MNKDIEKILDFLCKKNALTFSGKNFIQIYSLGALNYKELQAELKKYKNLSSHAGYECILVESF